MPCAVCESFPSEAEAAEHAHDHVTTGAGGVSWERPRFALGFFAATPAPPALTDTGHAAVVMLMFATRVRGGAVCDGRCVAGRRAARTGTRYGGDWGRNSYA